MTRRTTEEEIKLVLRKRLIILMTSFNEKGINSILDHFDEKEMFELYSILKRGIDKMNKSID